METTLDEFGQIVISKEIRDDFNLKPGRRKASLCFVKVKLEYSIGSFFHLIQKPWLSFV